MSDSLVIVISLLLELPVTLSIFTAAMVYVGRSFIHLEKSRYNISAYSKTGDLTAVLVLLDGWCMTRCFEVRGLQLE